MKPAYERHASEVALDLEACFLSLEDAIDALFERAAREGWPPEKLVAEVTALMGPDKEGSGAGR